MDVSISLITNWRFPLRTDLLKLYDPFRKLKILIDLLDPNDNLDKNDHLAIDLIKQLLFPPIFRKTFSLFLVDS